MVDSAKDESGRDKTRDQNESEKNENKDGGKGKEDSSNKSDSDSFTPSTFEKGSLKVYVCIECVLIHKNSREKQITQIACYNGNNGQSMYTCILPMPWFVSSATKKVYSRLPWVNVKIDTRMITANVRGAPDLTPVPQARGLRAFLDFVKAAAQDNRKTTLVMHSKEEFCQLTGFLALTRGGRPALRNLYAELTSLVDSLILHENNLPSAKDELKPLAVNSSEDAESKPRADALVLALRELFANEKRAESSYTLTLLRDKPPSSQVNVKSVRPGGSKLAHFLLISPQHIELSPENWFAGAPNNDSLVDEEVRLDLIPGDENCVTAFKAALFGFHQPVVVKFKDIEETTNTIEYSTDVEDYRREGTTSLFTYNSVKFAIINLHYAEIEDIRLQASSLKPDEPNIDMHIKTSLKIISDNTQLIKFTQKSQVLGPSMPEKPEDTIKVDLIFRSGDPTSTVTFNKENISSILVDMVTISEKEFSTDDVFMINSPKNKNFVLVNKLFCIVKEKTNLARIIIRPEVTVHLTPGTSVGTAILVNKQNFEEALVAGFHVDEEIGSILSATKEERCRERREREKDEARRRQRAERNDKARLPPARRPDKFLQKLDRDDREKREKRGLGNQRIADEYLRMADPENYKRKKSRVDSERGRRDDQRDQSYLDGRRDFEERGEQFDQAYQEPPPYSEESSLFTRRDDVRNSSDNAAPPHQRQSGRRDARSYFM